MVGPVSQEKTYYGIRELVDFLRENNLGEIFSPEEKPVDHTKDWRSLRSEAETHFEDLDKFIREKIDLLVADLRGASVGRTIEQMLARKYGKPVIGYAPDPINSPWPLIYTTKIVQSLDELKAEVLKL